MKAFIHIVHLEDSPADAELVESKLTEAGLAFRLARVQTRDEFEAALSNGRVDLIVADYQLPEFDGMSALHLAKELCPHVPFIFVSGTMGEEVAIEALTQGATDYVLKNNLLRLSSAVKRALLEARNLRESTQAKEALQHSNDLLTAIIEAAPVAIIGLDLDGHVSSVWNPAAEKMLGWRALDVMGRPLPIVPPDNQEGSSGFRKQISKGLTLDGIEVIRKRRDGTPINYSIYASPLHDATGHINGNIAILVDITERKQTEQQLALVNFALNGIHEAAFLIDENACFKYVNDEACRLLGYSREELLAMTVPEINLRFPMGQWSDHWRDLAEQGTLTFEGELKTKESGLLPVEINTNYFEYEGESYNLGLARDITERKQLEKERLANLRFFKSMNKVNQAIQKASELDQMMGSVLDTVLELFDCDKTRLIYPCNPEADTWTVQMERTKPGYQGIAPLNTKIPMTPEIAEMHRISRETERPVTFGAGSDLPMTPAQIEVGDQSGMQMAIYPTTSDAWNFSLEQGSHPRIWTNEELRLFEAIGRRLADSLTGLMSVRDLRKNEEFLNNVVDNIPNMVFVKDAQTLKFVRFNKAGEQLVGYPREKLIGKTDHDIFSKEMADFFAAEDRQVLDDKTLVDIPEETIRSSCNEERILHTKKIPILDETGAPQYLLGISEDITQRRLAEKKMFQSDQRLRLHRELSPLGFLEWDDDFRAIEWNAACERIFGYTREEAIGRYAKELILPGEVHDLVEGIFHDLLNHTGGQHSINKNVTKDGRIIICEWFNTTLVDQEGKAIGIASVCNDITEQKLSEEYIRKLSQAVEQSPVSIVITDDGGSIEFVNSKFSRITGYSSAEALGQNPRILKSGGTPSETYRQLWKTISSGGVWKGEFRNRKKNGELFWEHATIAPVRDTNNMITHYVALKEDISERKKLEEQLRQSQKMEAIGQLAGGVAHDFNNMMGVIIGHAEMALVNMAADNPLRERLDIILTAALRSTEITRQLLAFARKQTISPKVLDLNETIEGMLKLLRRLIGEDIDLAWLPGAKLWPVKMDPSQIDQILANLCINARDAIDGVGKVIIETQKVVFDETYCAEHRGFSSGDFVMLAVSDNGGGMDKNIMNKIFEPFFTTKGIGKGTGLGLSTVYGIVKQNAGFINVYSEPGQGSTFKIYLPKHSAGTTDQEPKVSQSARDLSGHETILLVEDEISHLNMVEQILESYGYHVLKASTPGEAIASANEQDGRIHLLLTDLIMPEMNGKDLSKEIIAFYPDIRCVFMSGYSGNVIAHHGILDEGIHFIQKPFSMRVLVTMVRDVLDGK